VCDSALMVRSAIAHNADEASTITTPASMPPSGRITITVPRKPTTNAAMRRAWIFSRSTSTAPAVAKSGAVKLIAVTLGRPVRDSAEKKRSIETRPRMLRRACSGRRPVRTDSRPLRLSIGRRATTPNALRKNATSKGWSSPAVSSRIITCISENPNAERPIRNIPRRVPEARR
jgi:hypothetical protein